MHVAAPHDDGTFQHEEPEEDGDDDDDDSKDKKSGRRKIKIEFIQDKSRRHITFSKRKAGIMKKAYELSTLTGTQVLLLVVSETGLVYTFTTAKLQPLVTQPEGKNLIQACLNAPNGQLPSSMPVGQTINRAGPQRSRGSASSAPSTITLGKDSVGGPEDIDDGEGSHSTGASPVNAPRQPQIPARRDNGSPQQSHQPYGLPPTQQYPPPPQQQSDSLYGHHQPPPSMLPYHMPQHPAPPPPASWAVPQQGYQRR
ncbi:SRF-TF-domain-containing protein [Exidia glandulosa HHB12029]|uniref:SRF-TF-domain-containing protein n=1 Tax=Exidia glandulosa HHB12029 TaxID=1314781 RepID=A0A165ISG5_EXIGL|nr:SRF-TF-domain-containing protein [Exidia glandulosa HHB12029]